MLKIIFLAIITSDFLKKMDSKFSYLVHVNDGNFVIYHSWQSFIHESIQMDKEARNDLEQTKQQQHKLITVMTCSFTNPP